ncbi:MAG: hypothetical protein KDC48_21985, partial [Planctomycetes bacterium]|nr:hypothetical protein [Planctomycetota bacterium]
MDRRAPCRRSGRDLAAPLRAAGRSVDADSTGGLAGAFEAAPVPRRGLTETANRMITRLREYCRRVSAQPAPVQEAPGMSAFRRDSVPRRLVAATLCVTLAGSPVAPLRGDAIRDAAEQGQAAGREVVQPFGNAPPPAPVTASELFQGPDGPPLTDFTAVYGNDGQATSAGIAGRTTLRTSPSPSGEAYRAILDGADRARPDMRSDPIWRQTDDVRANFDALAATFSSCTTHTAFADTTRTITTRTVEPCERAVDV